MSTHRLALLAARVFTHLHITAADRPGVVLIFAEDRGNSDPRCLNSDGKIPLIEEGRQTIAHLFAGRKPVTP